MKFNREINLNDNEKRIFLKLILKIIVANGVIDDGESEIIKKIGAAYKFSPEMLAEAKASFKQEISDSELAQISTRLKKLELIKCLCFVASIDDTLDDRELDLIVEVSKKLDVSMDKLLEINQLVQDIILVEEKNKYIMELQA